MTQGGPTTAKQSGGGTVVLVILSLAMFVYVIDTTLMNVSISALGAGNRRSWYRDSLGEHRQYRLAGGR